MANFARATWSEEWTPGLLACDDSVRKTSCTEEAINSYQLGPHVHLEFLQLNMF